MNNKDNLQKEILNKIKEEIKPSDIKKLKNNTPNNSDNSNNIPIAPPYSEKILNKNNNIKEKSKQILTKKEPLIENIVKPKKTVNVKDKVKKTISYKMYFKCDGCLETKEGSFKQGSYVKRLVDSPFELRLHKKLCFICQKCRPYWKEYNEARDWDRENDPHRQSW